ncbi:hypothetical protein QJS04_geneDACA019348 [Acorus gramineus]|uniref:Uncharacterized protein n=1 Tax=Acorus gramineus TaxID=55184 RepID=A0AAV9AQ83_ACOGR|nr:hypothetical protein QJS04_geneDACA019348 [Acorus gramineus]
MIDWIASIICFWPPCGLPIGTFFSKDNGSSNPCEATVYGGDFTFCKVTEAQRTDLVGEFVGHTGPKTRRKMAQTPLHIVAGYNNEGSA